MRRAFASSATEFQSADCRWSKNVDVINNAERLLKKYSTFTKIQSDFYFTIYILCFIFCEIYPFLLCRLYFLNRLYSRCLHDIDEILVDEHVLLTPFSPSVLSSNSTIQGESRRAHQSSRITYNCRYLFRVFRDRSFRGPERPRFCSTEIAFN